jgi:acyl-CoA hydrolase
VELEARLIHTGPHSMHIAVHVRARDPRETAWRDTTQCMTIFVTRDESGRASDVRQLVPATEEDRRLDAHAVDLVRRRAELSPLRFATARVY